MSFLNPLLFNMLDVFYGSISVSLGLFIISGGLAQLDDVMIFLLFGLGLSYFAETGS
jgi:hypothetical protein